MKCPYCAEEIQADAKKCRHCGEWLEPAKGRQGANTIRGSADARAVSKGIKEKERHESVYKLIIFIGMVIGLFAGLNTDSWAVGIGVCFGIALLGAWWYYRE